MPTRRRACLTGLIPAHAGKTLRMMPRLSGVPAHPRSRGENAGTSMEDMGAIGSSPLTRGKLPAQGMTLEYTRLIPAHAGKTPRPHADPPTGQAHPRSRGENGDEWVRCASHHGSSPLTRGKLLNAQGTADTLRLIPAHAGKTWTPSWSLVAHSAHPRSRGENTFAGLQQQAGGGSSPLTRGKQPACQDQRHLDGLIPAHAGKTGHRRTLRT